MKRPAFVEQCSCGARLEFSWVVGKISESAIIRWRDGHPCPNRVVPAQRPRPRGMTADTRERIARHLAQRAERTDP